MFTQDTIIDSATKEILMKEAETDMKILLGKSTPSKVEIERRYQELLAEELKLREQGERQAA